MALVLADRVNETTTTAGTGTLTLAGAVSGYRSFSTIGNANTTYYTIVHQTANEWEVGIGTYTSAGTTLSRDTVLASSNSGSLVNFSAGTKFVFCDYPAGRAVYLDTATNTTLPGVTLSNGTANRVQYLNASKVLTGSANLTFDGTTLTANDITDSSLTSGRVVYAGTGGNLVNSANLTFDGTTLTANTLTGRFNPRVVSAASASSLTPDISAADQYNYTALAANLTINAPTGTPLDGNKLIFRILDNGTSRTLTWNATFTAIGVTLPTVTTVSKTTYVGCVYNANNTRWDVTAVTTQA